MSTHLKEDLLFANVVRDYEVSDHLAHAISDQQAGRLNEAVQAYQRVLEADQRNPVALNNLSLMLDDDQALLLLSRAIEAQPDYADALINYSVRLINVGHKNDAKKYLKRATTLLPHDDRVQGLLQKLDEGLLEEENQIGMQNELPIFSIIIPTHKRAKLLSRALASIKQQTSKVQYEIIVISDVVDQSTDNVCREWLQQTDTYIRRSGKPGPSASRNLAIKLAKGKVVLFLDDDDSWHNNLLDDLDKCDLLQRGELVYFNSTIVKESRHLDGPIVHSETFSDSQHLMSEHVFVKNQVHMSCFAIPRQILQNLEFDPYMRAYEDWDFLLSLFEKKSPIHVPILGSRIHEVNDETSDRRGDSRAANDGNAVIDYLYVYRRHPVQAHLRQKRAEFLQKVGFPIPADLL